MIDIVTHSSMCQKKSNPMLIRHTCGCLLGWYTPPSDWRTIEKNVGFGYDRWHIEFVIQKNSISPSYLFSVLDTSLWTRHIVPAGIMALVKNIFFRVSSTLKREIIPNWRKNRSALGFRRSLIIYVWMRETKNLSYEGWIYADRLMTISDSSKDYLSICVKTTWVIELTYLLWG